MSIIKNGIKIAGSYKVQVAPEASTEEKGVIRIATDEEVKAGISNTTAITPSQLANQAPKTLVDDTTITKDLEDTITAIGVQSKSGNVLYDWIGTNEEYEAGIADGSILLNWVCWITDDNDEFSNYNYANKDLNNLSDKGKLLFNDKASISLDNLNTEGEKHFLNKTQVTNCITEIPQRIKYTLENGTLTIKAGSVVIVPYGTTDRTSEFPVGATFINENFKVYDTCYADGKFFVWVELVSDCVRPPNGTDSGTQFSMIRISTGEVACYNKEAMFSGSSQPTVMETYNMWYNTTANLIANSSDKGATWITTTIISLPFLICEKVSGNFNNVNQVFNGFGYIGSTVWVDKGVKGLIPNGRNEDGTLRNKEITITKVFVLDTYNRSDTDILYISDDGHLRPFDCRYFYVDKYPTPASNTWYLVYSTSENMFYKSDNGNDYVKTSIYFVGEINSVYQGNITSFNPKQTFRAVDYNDFANTPHIVETYKNGASWYRVYSDGWIEQGGRIVINSATVGGGTYNNTTLTFIKPFSKLMSWHCQARHDRFNAGFNANVGGAVSSVDVYQVNDATASFSNAFVLWEAKGYIA